MEYTYIPNTYNNNLIGTNFDNANSFVSAQVLYRKGFEQILKQYVDFSKVDQFIASKNYSIPTVTDIEHNFYHKFSTLGSKYLFVRNNFHVEKLSKEELQILFSGNADANFYKNTISSVMYEDGNEVFFGIPMDENLVKSKSIVFEFAYDQKKCTDLNQLNEIEKCINDIFNFINNSVHNTLKLELSFIVYKAIPDLYHKDEINSALIL